MKKPTPDEIKKQVEELTAIKPNVRHKSGFGDNHHDAIDAQIEVLERRLSEREIDDRSAFEDEPDYHDTDKWKTNVRDAAMDARRWLDGEYTDASDIVASWDSLLIPEPASKAKGKAKAKRK